MRSNLPRYWVFHCFLPPSFVLFADIPGEFKRIRCYLNNTSLSLMWADSPLWSLSSVALSVAFACGNRIIQCSQWASATWNCAKIIAITSRLNRRNNSRWWILIWNIKDGMIHNNQPVTKNRSTANVDCIARAQCSTATNSDCRGCREFFFGVCKTKAWLANQI